MKTPSPRRCRSGTTSRVDDSYERNGSRGYLSFAADHRELDNIPVYPPEQYEKNSEEVWQKLICGPDSSYLSKMQDGDFDGVYHDIIDAFEYFEGM